DQRDLHKAIRRQRQRCIIDMYKIDNANKLIVEFICGSKSPSDNDLAAISSFLSDSNSNLELRWGLTSDESLGESHKVVLLASISVKKNI
ncbi:MAG: hypothetical protein K2K32_09370, partial [Muribaculaceae bacterium]|nr:hypothetical protein [Muribaculaceae bacterium]